MKKKGLILIILFGFVSFTYAQNNHYVILRKQKPIDQWYYCGESFPEEQIKAKWNESYMISCANFKEKTWFIVMDKTVNSVRQEYLFNPSDQIINEKLEDGFNVQDACNYLINNRIGTVVILTKLSDKPVNLVFHNFVWRTSVYKRLEDEIVEGKMNGYYCIKARCMYHDLQIYNNSKSYIILIKKPINDNFIEQRYFYRKESPNDLINNKKSEGYFLTSIAFDKSEESWFILMTKYKITIDWIWLNYRSQKEIMEKYIKEKAYAIVDVY